MFLNLLAGDKVKELYSIKKNYDEDCGFDLYFAEDQVIEGLGNKIDLDIRCEMIHVYDVLWNGEERSEMKYCAFDLRTRSSISKTPLRLSNSIGTIDKNYRGPIIAMVDNLSNEPYTIKKGERLFQITRADLNDFSINFVKTLSKTGRGESGIGSTGA